MSSTFDEVGWWKTDNKVATSTYHEETKQLVYASRMGLRASWEHAHPPLFDLEGRSVVDIGGGPVSLLLKCIHRGKSVVVDPGAYPAWVKMRYQECGIRYMQMPAERYTPGDGFDEAWIYNCLQHVEDPEFVIQKARDWSDVVRIFEWINIPAYNGHPHELTEEALNAWLGAPGYVTEVNEMGAVGRAYYGVFAQMTV